MNKQRQDQWNRDTAIEQIAAGFLDTNFYPSFSLKAKVSRHSDTWHQFGGVDVSINATNFDEKCKCYGCLNTVLQYVGIECSILNKAQNVTDGWFMNDSLSTDYYSFIGLSASVNDVNQLTSESQVSAADVLWVKKEDIKDYIEKYTALNSIKLDAENLRIESDNIENGDECYASLPTCLGYTKAKDGKYRQKYPHGKFWLTYSSHMHEKPVNLIMQREVLEQLPHSKHFIVTHGHTAVI